MKVMFWIEAMYTFIPVLLVLIFDKMWNIKSKLISQFSKIKTYKLVLFVVALSSFIALFAFLTYSDSRYKLIWPYSVMFTYHYLLKIPDHLKDE